MLRENTVLIDWLSVTSKIHNCDFEYEIRATSKGSMARLSDIEVIGDTNIVLETLPKK